MITVKASLLFDLSLFFPQPILRILFEALLRVLPRQWQFFVLFYGRLVQAAGEEENGHVEHEHDATDIHLLVTHLKRQVGWLSHHRHCQKGLT